MNRTNSLKISFKMLIRLTITFGVLGVLLGLLSWVTSHKPAKTAEPPKVTDWMQGWGSLLGLLTAAAAALAAAAVYWQGVEAAARAEERRLEDRAEAAEAARLAEERWHAERKDAREAALGAERRWRAELEQTRRIAFTDQLLNAVSDMMGALAELSEEAMRLDTTPLREAASREALREPFRRFQQTSYRVEILEFSLRGDDDYGSWLRGVANNFSADLLQADEFAAMANEMTVNSHKMPPGLSHQQRVLIRQSKSYFSVTMVGLDPPVDVPEDFQPLEAWWAEKITESGNEPNAVYSIDAPYLVQVARLLDGFRREYVDPWAKRLITEGLAVRDNNSLGEIR
jgi:hypothetical protein